MTGGGAVIATNNGPKLSRQLSAQAHKGNLSKVLLTRFEGDHDGEKSGGGADDQLVLPPLSKSARAAEALDGLLQTETGDVASPAKRSRKKLLVSHSEASARSLIQTSLDIDMRERELAMVRESRREYGRMLVEMWVNQVLDPGGTDLTSPQARNLPTQPDITTMKGLASFGLTRVELQGAGLSPIDVDRLYRGLYVYTIGFFDMMQDILEHSEFRLEILSNVWRAFLSIAEAALKVAFKGDYLQLFQAQQITAAELLVAKEALAEATKDAYATEKALAWLTAAHAEERALRSSARADMVALSEQLSKEQQAHQAAVTRVVTEMETRSRLNLEISDLKGRLNDAASAHAELLAQRDHLSFERNDLEDKCIYVLADVNDLYKALAMDDTLSVPADIAKALREAEEQAEAAGLQGTDMTTLKARSSAVRAMTRQLYTLWRDEVAEHCSTKRDLYNTKDTLRTTKLNMIQAQEDCEAARADARLTHAHLDQTQHQLEETQATLASTEGTLQETRSAQLLAEEEVARLNQQVANLEALLLKTGQERDSLAGTCEKQAGELRDFLSRQEELVAQLQHTNWTSAQLSKGLAVAMRSLDTNQCARRVLQRKLEESRAEVTKLVKDISATSRQNRVLEGKVEMLEINVQDLQMNLSDCERQKQAVTEELDTAHKKVVAQTNEIDALETTRRGLDSDLKRVSAEYARTHKLLVATEESLEQERVEVMRLYTSMQELEDKLKAGAEERNRLVKKLEQAKSETSMMEDKSKRRESTLELEIKRLQSEVRLERSKLQAAEMQLESSRKTISEGQDLLARKRQKKRKWKKVYNDTTSELQAVRAQLELSRAAVTVLEQRLLPLEVDLAVLCADRGRPMPVAPSRLTNSGLRSSQPATPQGGSRSQAGTPMSQTRSTAKQQGLYEGSGATPRGLTGVDADAPGDISATYLAWDEGNRQALSIQLKIDQHNKTLDTARRQYERARAIYYTNPVDKTLQERMLTAENELTAARSRREELETSLEEVTESMRKLQSEIYAYETECETNRVESLKARTGQQDLSMRTEMSLRCDDADARTREVQRLLEEQRTAYDMLLASRKHLEGETARIEEELRKLGSKLQMTINEKLDLDEHLRQSRGQIQGLQTDILGLLSAKESAEAKFKEQTKKVQGMQSDLEAAAANVVTSIRRAEAKLQAENKAIIEALTREKEEIAAQMQVKQALADELQADKKRLTDQLRTIVMVCFDEREVGQKPSVGVRWQLDPDQFLFLLRPPTYLTSAQQVFPDLKPTSCINLDDPVAQFIAPRFDTLLIIIGHIYMTKIQTDSSQDEGLLGGRVGTRSDLDDIVYDYFVSRYGTRASAELHLSAFLWAVQKHRLQHVKIRIFASMLGLEEPLPKAALEFYCALLNRIHARAGPLVTEATDGQTLIRCKVVARAARELLRGSFANINDDAAGLSDALKHLAMGDEEQPVELEVALDMATKAWCRQFNLDLQAMEVALRKDYGGRDMTPDDLADFLKKLDAAKAADLPREELLTIYRRAIRSAGPAAQLADQRRAFATQILEQGFAGMGGYRGRLEPVKAPPPFDEFMLIEESWRAMRHVVEHQLTVLDEHRQVRADVPAYVELARKLDMALELRDDPALPWSLYRSLVVCYQQYRKPVERIQPFEPPSGNEHSMLTRPPTADHDEAAAAIAAAEQQVLAAKAAGASKPQQKARPARRKSSFGGATTFDFSARTSQAGSEAAGESPADAQPERKSGYLKPREDSSHEDVKGADE